MTVRTPNTAAAVRTASARLFIPWLQALGVRMRVV
jgi:hypothetical protein